MKSWDADVNEPESLAPEVVIVGAGPVGLSLAIELGIRKRRVLLIERQTMRGPQPRAKTLNMRSLEHFRRWGVADQVRAASPLSSDTPCDVIFQTRLFGHHIATVPNIYFRGGTHGNDPRFCEPSEWIPQHAVEGVLRAKVAGLPNIICRYDAEVVDLSQDEMGAQVTVRTGSGSEWKTRAAYVVGADGARSTIRNLIGAKMDGRYAFAANYNLLLRIPELTRSPPQPRGLMHWIINADSPAVVGPIGDLWYLAKQLPAGKSELSDEEVHACVVGAVGREIDYEVVTVDPWYAHELIADKYRSGRIFLAGDACHLHPPFGGYGMNMGIGDAVDLGWKLDAVLAGWADERLLESYEFERRRVDQWAIDEAVANYSVLSGEMLRPGLEDDTPEGQAIRDRLAVEAIAQKAREFHTIGLVLGYHYGGSPVIAGDDHLLRPEAEHYVASVKAGVLAPHVWLAPGLSLYDRFGSGFTLINTGAAVTANALRRVASEMSVPLDVLALDDPRVVELYGVGLTLIRPDQHIAWYGREIDEQEARKVLSIVTARQ